MFVFGIDCLLQPLCWCQKQPLTKMTVFAFGITISGLPGSLSTCSLYLQPCLVRVFLTIFSGRVSLLLILDMHTLLCFFVKLSIRHLHLEGNLYSSIALQFLSIFSGWINLCAVRLFRLWPIGLPIVMGFYPSSYPLCYRERPIVVSPKFRPCVTF